MKYIVVHGGRAHLDDVMACALAMAKKAKSVAGDKIAYSGLEDHEGPLPVYRRDPTAEELEDPLVLVMDVGRRYAPTHSNFDHHQMPRHMKECAMQLLAQHIRVPYEPSMLYAAFLPQVFGWWETAVSVDQLGPFDTARNAGLEWKKISPFFGPLAGAYLKMFEDAKDHVARGKFVYDTLTKMVDDKVAAWYDINEHLTATMVGPVEVLDFTKANPETCEEASSSFISQLDGGVAVFCSRPRRDGEDWYNTGLTLMRIADDKRIDFTLVKDDPEVSFAHAGGFLCATKTRDMEKAKKLIEAATRKEVLP